MKPDENTVNGSETEGGSSSIPVPRLTAEAQAAIDAVRQSVIDAAREFRDKGTVLTACNRGPCQRVVEHRDNSDPQAKLFAALKNLDTRLKALEERQNDDR